MCDQSATHTNTNTMAAEDAYPIAKTDVREKMTKYWAQHSEQGSVQEMMLDDNADKIEAQVRAPSARVCEPR